MDDRAWRASRFPHRGDAAGGPAIRSLLPIDMERMIWMRRNLHGATFLTTVLVAGFSPPARADATVPPGGKTGTKEGAPTGALPVGTKSDFERVVRNDSTSPSYVLIKVIDGDTNAAEIVCVLTPSVVVSRTDTMSRSRSGRSFASSERICTKLKAHCRRLRPVSAGSS